MTTIPLTEKQAAIFGFIREEIETKRMPPTVRDICAKFGFRSPNGAMAHLNALVAKGYITRDENHARGIRLVGEPPYEKLLRDDSERLFAENADLRDAIRLIVGRSNNVPWKDVHNEVVEGWLGEIQALKASRPLTGFEIEDDCDLED